MPRIGNLTQHRATIEQSQAGVADMPEAARTTLLLPLLTFDHPPTPAELIDTAAQVAFLHSQQFPTANVALIGGAPYLMPPLEKALISRGVAPVYAFSKRETTETARADGAVHKTTIFKHIGFVEADLGEWGL